MTKIITLFCSSSSTIPEKYVEATQKLVKSLVLGNFEILTGGGNGGLMAVIAESAKYLGGSNVGVMPDFMAKNDWTNPNISEYIITNDMAGRKEKLIKLSDAIIVLPGSIGTWEEAFEAMTLRKLRQIDIPIIIYNMYGFYNPWLTMMEKAINEGFMQNTDVENWHILDSQDAVMDIIEKI